MAKDLAKTIQRRSHPSCPRVGWGRGCTKKTDPAKGSAKMEWEILISLPKDIRDLNRWEI
jgi:hypothetical protein